MKLIDYLKKLGINIDGEITSETEIEVDDRKIKLVDYLKDRGIDIEGDISADLEIEVKSEDNGEGDKKDGKASDEDGKASEEKKEEDKKEEGNKEEDKKEEGNKEEDKPAVEKGWFNSETLEIDETKIHNEEILKAVKALRAETDRVKTENEIDSTLKELLKEESLNVSYKTFKKNLDLSGVKRNKDGKLEGIKEAIAGLKEEEPGFFKIEDKKGKKEESNPLKESFNPADKSNTNKVITSDEAWASRSK